MKSIFYGRLQLVHDVYVGRLLGLDTQGAGVRSGGDGCSRET